MNKLISKYQAFVLLIGIMFSGITVGCLSKKTSFHAEDKNTYTSLVNPHIGTGGHGHTYPGATVPHGMVQLSPDTRLLHWDACAGYHYSDSIILGFTHTHLSGTGIGDYGDILLMPYLSSETCKDSMLEVGQFIQRKRWQQSFSHDNEVATPGYYKVKLEPSNIDVELTSDVHTGWHQYTFPCLNKDKVNMNDTCPMIILDLVHTLQGHKNTKASLDIISNTEIQGMKSTKGWAKKQPIYFYATFSKPFKATLYDRLGKRIAQDQMDKACTAVLSFKQDELCKSSQIVAKVSISAVSLNGAKKNQIKEAPGWDFPCKVKQNQHLWNEALSTIHVETEDEISKKIFYTALYHTLVVPNTFSDVDGQYLGQDLKVHTSNQPYFTVFSLWDTFRAYHPLLSIIDPECNNLLAATLIQKYVEGGYLPKWDLWSNYTGTMTGYHAVSVIAEAYLKGASNFNAELALEACLHASKYSVQEKPYIQKQVLRKNLMPVGIKYKNENGYIPADVMHESVANGLEYAYTDWCIAQMAKKMGREDIFKEYSKKAKNYAHYFDKTTGFMRGKLKNGSWRTPFNPKESNHREDDYCEGNAWQWSWYVPHDVEGLVNLHDGRQPFIQKLDSLFAISSDLVGNKISNDITGLIGQYAHGNEPSHHITHLYNYVGQPWKTQELVDKVLKTMYFDHPNGLAGNEDCGQMSAWYILNSIGLYSIAPASKRYTWGRPIFDKVTIPLPNNKRLSIKTINNAPKHKYIQSICINGINTEHISISYEELMKGPDVVITMGAEPNKNLYKL